MASSQFPDRRVGDGDCGTTLRKGAEVILSDLTSRWGGQSIATLRLRLGTADGGVLITLVVSQTTVTGSHNSQKVVADSLS